MEYFQVSKIFKILKVCFQFLLQCLYVELPSSLHESPYWQFVIGQSTSWLYSMLFFFSSFFTFSTVSLPGNGFRYAT